MWNESRLVAIVSFAEPEPAGKSTSALESRVVGSGLCSGGRWKVFLTFSLRLLFSGRTQQDLIRMAFAGDDVEAEFAEAKRAEVRPALPPSRLSSSSTRHECSSRS